MRAAAAFIAIIALAILVFSATMFDAPTVAVIAVAMAIVSFFSGATVMLGVMTRRASNSSTRVDDEAEVIHDEDRSSSRG